MLKSRIERVMELDPRTPSNGRYVIHSLYFDDYKDTSLYTTESGLSRRLKWRIRYYDDDLTYVVLEKKEKVNGRCHKKSCKLTLEEYSIITSGNITDILYDTNKKLILELARDMMLYNYSVTFKRILLKVLFLLTIFVVKAL